MPGLREVTRGFLDKVTCRQGTEVEQVTKQLGKDAQQKKEPWQRLGGEKQWLS